MVRVYRNFLRSQEFFEIEIEKPKNDLFTPVGYQDRNNSQIMIDSWLSLHNQKSLDIFKVNLQKKSKFLLLSAL